MKLHFNVCIPITLLFQKIEPWEREKCEADMEYYDWNASMSRKSVTGLLSWKLGQNVEEGCTDNIQLDLKGYKEAVSNIMNEGTVEIQFQTAVVYEGSPKIYRTFFFFFKFIAVLTT